MPNNPIRRLVNEQVNKDGFRKTRGRTEVEDAQDEEPKIIRDFQKERLRTANALYFTQRRNRLERKTIELPSSVDLIEIHFYTRFNTDLQKKFQRQYGLDVISYKNFNKTVVFEVISQDLFATFVHHVSLVVDSPDDEPYQGKEFSLIALIKVTIY